MFWFCADVNKKVWHHLMASISVQLFFQILSTKFSVLEEKVVIVVTGRELT